MSRTTLSPAKRGVAGLTAAALTFGTLGLVLSGTSSAAGPVITIDTVTVANPVPTKTTPTIDAAGPFSGKGAAVTIVGTNFPATPTVTFGTAAATSILRVSDTVILAKAPEKTGVTTADVAVPVVVGEDDSVADADESADVTKANAYTYKAAPSLTEAKYSDDKKQLIITGTNLKDTQTLQLGPLTVKVKPTEVNADGTTVTVKVPSALTRASYAITANTHWGSGTLTSGWSVIPVASKIVAATSTVAVKSADSLNPNTIVRITGKSLGGVDSVSFGGASATFFVSNDNELVVKVPAMAATETVTTNIAKVNVVVKNGALAAAKPLTFEYKVAPIVSSLSYDGSNVVGDVTAATNTVVTVNGQNLLGAKLYFGSAKGAKALSPKTGSSAISAQYTMPKTSGTGFALGTAYELWLVSKGGNLNTGRKITVTAGS